MAPCPLTHTLPDEYGGRDRLSPDFYEESETDPGAEELPARIFVALFDYDPLTMSPNPDAAEEELPFTEGQIIKVGARRGVEGVRGTGSGRGCAHWTQVPEHIQRPGCFLLCLITFSPPIRRGGGARIWGWNLKSSKCDSPRRAGEAPDSRCAHFSGGHYNS